jgi:hypothetical protein
VEVMGVIILKFEQEFLLILVHNYVDRCTFAL